MKNPWFAEKKDLKKWAYDADASWPTQDFDLFVAEIRFVDVILELGCDKDCPKREFFLQCAYLIVGDAVRTEYETSSQTEVEQFLEKVRETGAPDLLKLHERSVYLMSNPSTFDYDMWCDGGYLRT